MIGGMTMRSIAPLLAAVLVVGTGVPAQQIEPRGVQGTLCIGGGGKLPDAIYERFLAAAGGADAHIVIVPTASSRADTEEGRKRSLARWQKAHPGVTFELLHTRDSDEADTEAFTAPLRKATGLWFGGGSQSRLMKAYVGTRFEKELHALLARGGIVGGSSAGAAIQTRTMIAGGKVEPALKTGFDLLPNAIVDQHFLARERLPRLVAAVTQVKGTFGVGIDEGTALFVNARRIDVVGKSKALFVLPASAGKERRVVELKDGEHADLVTWQRAARQRKQGPWPKAQRGKPVVASGALLLGGGGALPDSVFARFVELAGGKAAKIVIVPTASAASPRRKEWVRGMAARFRKLGAAEVESLESDHATQVTEADIAKLDACTAVWFGGGRQWRIVDAFEPTAVVAAFHRVLARGGAIGGSSAGATIQGEFLVRGNPLGNRDMWCEGYDRGFCFLPGCAVDQHFVARKRIDDLRELIQRAPQLIGIGVDEGTAAVVTGSTLEVVGKSIVVVLDRVDKGEDATPTWLSPGQKWDLVTARPTK